MRCVIVHLITYLGSKKIEMRKSDELNNRMGINAISNNIPNMFKESADIEQIIPSFSKKEDEQDYGICELWPGITSEEMKAKFFDADALIEPPYKLWQLNSKNHRYYYRYDTNNNIEFFASATTILSQTLPKSKILIEWMADQGIEEAQRFMYERSMYGTFMHMMYEDLLINRSFDLDSIEDKLFLYIEMNRLPHEFIRHADELKKDVLSFAQFILDYDVRPLAVEVALLHPNYNYAGMIDCCCTMRSSKNSNNRINAIIDFKSGRKGFFEEMEIQLHMYRDMWNANFGEYPVSKVFNFSAKNWIKAPSYNLKDQTNSINAGKIRALLELAAIEDEKRNRTFTLVSGSISLDSDTDLSNNITSLTLSDLVRFNEQKSDVNNASNKPSEAKKNKSDSKPRQSGNNCLKRTGKGKKGDVSSNNDSEI